MGIESMHLNLNLKIKHKHGIGYGDVFGTEGITGRRIARTLGKL